MTACARGVSGSFSWDPAPETEQGFALSLTRTLGGPALQRGEALFGQSALADPDGETRGELDSRRFEARLGYGFNAFGGGRAAVLSVCLSLSESAREYRMGSRLARRVVAGLGFVIDLEGTRRHPAGGTAGREHGVLLGIGWRLDGADGRGLALSLQLSERQAANDNGRPLAINPGGRLAVG